MLVSSRQVSFFLFTKADVLAVASAMGFVHSWHDASPSCEHHSGHSILEDEKTLSVKNDLRLNIEKKKTNERQPKNYEAQTSTIK